MYIRKTDEGAALFYVLLGLTGAVVSGFFGLWLRDDLGIPELWAFGMAVGCCLVPVFGGLAFIFANLVGYRIFRKYQARMEE